LSNVTEHQKGVELLLEKLEGSRGEVSDIEACTGIANRLHLLSIIRGDLNRHNFIVSSEHMNVIDFENTSRRRDAEVMKNELDSLMQLVAENMGRMRMTERWGG
jgi:tRNA A-37 threonylcarbamoyl transferase component Bud32